MGAAHLVIAALDREDLDHGTTARAIDRLGIERATLEALAR
ncbi:hypothetical protein [Arthrobacter sp. TMS1-12-1]